MNHEHLLIKGLLNKAQTLNDVSASPQLDCQLILSRVLGCTREWLIAHNEDSVCSDHAERFDTMMACRQQGQPVAYLLGYRDFWDLRFKVTQDTLIPRPETELLIETILDTFDNTPITVGDFGTGCGAVAVTLAHARPTWQIIGLDISYEALQVARINGAGINSEGCQNLHWVQADWGSALGASSLDLLVCNPPYIAAGDPHLDRLGFEPVAALISADSGLADLKRVILAATKVLKEDGYLLLEHGHEQQQEVCNYLQSCEFTATALDDLCGKPRAVLARKSGQICTLSR